MKQQQPPTCIHEQALRILLQLISAAVLTTRSQTEIYKCSQTASIALTHNSLEALVSYHRPARHETTTAAHLVWVKELHILPQLAVAAVLTVGHQVDEAVPLLAHGKGLALHLVHPSSWHETHNLSHGSMLIPT